MYSCITQIDSEIFRMENEFHRKIKFDVIFETKEIIIKGRKIPAESRNLGKYVGSVLTTDKNLELVTVK